MPFRGTFLMAAQDLLGTSLRDRSTATNGIDPDQQIAARLRIHRQQQLPIARSSLIAQIQLRQLQRQCLRWMMTLLSLPLDHLKAKNSLNLAAVRRQVLIEVRQGKVGQYLARTLEHRQEAQIWITVMLKTITTLSRLNRRIWERLTCNLLCN